MTLSEAIHESLFSGECAVIQRVLLNPPHNSPRSRDTDGFRLSDAKSGAGVSSFHATGDTDA